jgi:hypothetical protein
MLAAYLLCFAAGGFVILLSIFGGADGDVDVDTDLDLDASGDAAGEKSAPRLSSPRPTAASVPS